MLEQSLAEDPADAFLRYGLALQCLRDGDAEEGRTRLLALIASCMIIYAVTIFFDYIAYTVMLPVLAGLSAALVRTADAEIERVKAVPLPVMMSPVWIVKPRGVPVTLVTWAV